MKIFTPSLFEGLSVTVGLLLGFGFFVIYVGIKGLICFTTIQALKCVPEEQRRIQPAMVWLLMIPGFSWVWNFVVFQKVPESFREFFRSKGGQQYGDCGQSLGRLYAIADLCWAIPIPPFSMLAWFTSWTLLLFSLAKYRELGGWVRSAEGQTSGTPPR